MAKVQNLVVYEADDLSCEYTLGAVTRTLPMLAAGEVQGGRITLMCDSSCPEAECPSEFARIVAEELNLDMSDLLLIFLPDIPDVLIRKSLEHKRVLELEELEAEDRAPDNAWFSRPPEFTPFPDETTISVSLQPSVAFTTYRCDEVRRNDIAEASS